MRNLFLTAMLALTSNAALAIEAPTVYGLINKEYRHVDQEKEALKTTSTGITDVDGFETRLGAKGGFDATDTLKVSYKIELGINSQKDNGGASSSTTTTTANGDDSVTTTSTSDTERIRIRLAQVDLKSSFGTFTIGQAWTPNTLKMLKLDPFTGTGAQLLGLESGDITGNVGGKYGVKANYFKDLITYTTPEMSGVQAYFTQYKTAAALSNTDSVSTVYEAVLAYNSKWFNPHFTYGKEEKRGNNDNANKYFNLAARFNLGKIMFSAGFGKETVGKSGTTDIEYDHMLAAFSYMMSENLTIAANYGTTDFGDKGTTTGDQTQFAVGPIYKFNKNFKTRLIYKNISRESKTALIGTKKENKANVLIAGLTVGF